MWGTVSFLAAQASLAGWSEARMSTIRELRMVRNTGCRNSRRMPRPINRTFSIEPPAAELFQNAVVRYGLADHGSVFSFAGILRHAAKQVNAKRHRTNQVFRRPCLRHDTFKSCAGASHCRESGKSRQARISSDGQAGDGKLSDRSVERGRFGPCHSQK